MLKTRNLLLSACVTLLCVPSVYGAFLQDYGAFSGTTVDYMSVTESHNGAVARFGAPAVFGDLLDFDPKGFNADNNGGPAVITDSQLNFMVMSKNNSNPITQLVFKESGDFTLAGVTGAIAKATAGMTVTIDVLEVNGAPAFTAGTQQSMTFLPNANGVFELPADAGTAVPWSGMLVYDLSAIPGVTKVKVVLDNTLTAAAANNGAAFIAKKDFSGLTVTIPEPSSASLLGLLAFAGRRFARRQLLAA